MKNRLNAFQPPALTLSSPFVLIIALVTLLCTCGSAQTSSGSAAQIEMTAAGTILKGTVTDSVTGKAIAFASIGIAGQPFGTIADINGNYQFELPRPIPVSDIIKVSAIGYAPDLRAVGSSEDGNRQLAPAALELTTINVSSQSFGPVEVLGKDKGSDRVTFYFMSNQLGTELGMALKEQPVDQMIKTLNFYLLKNTLGDVSFRAHLYAFQPDSAEVMRELLPRNYLVKTDQRDGWINVDVSDSRLIVPAGTRLVMSLEWLEGIAGAGNMADLQFGASLSRRGSIYVKRAAQDDWSFHRQRYYGMQTKLAFYAEVAPAVAIQK